MAIKRENTCMHAKGVVPIVHGFRSPHGVFLQFFSHASQSGPPPPPPLRTLAAFLLLLPKGELRKNIQEMSFDETRSVASRSSASLAPKLVQQMLDGCDT